MVVKKKIISVASSSHQKYGFPKVFKYGTISVYKICEARCSLCSVRCAREGPTKVMQLLRLFLCKKKLLNFLFISKTLFFSLCQLYSWRYDKLGDLQHVVTWTKFKHGNPGMFYDYQLIDVQDFNGVGESEPNPYFYQVIDLNCV